MKTIAFRIDDGLAEINDALAEITGETPSDIAREALRAYHSYIARKNPKFRKKRDELATRLLDKQNRAARQALGLDIDIELDEDISDPKP